MIFSYFKHYFIFFNVYKHLAALFVELERGGSSVGHLFLLFTLDYLSENSHSHTSLILLTLLHLTVGRVSNKMQQGKNYQDFSK